MLIDVLIIMLMTLFSYGIGYATCYYFSQDLNIEVESSGKKVVKMVRKKRKKIALIADDEQDVNETFQ